METVDIKLQRLSEMTQEEFEPFGWIIGRQDLSLPNVEVGDELTCYPDFLPHLKYDTGRLSMGMLVCSPKPTGALVDWMEYHETAYEFFFPLGGGEVIFVIAPAGEKPDPAKTKAIILGPNEGMLLKKCTWHHPPYGVSGVVSCLMPRYGDFVETPEGGLKDKNTVYYGALAEDGTEFKVRIVL